LVVEDERRFLHQWGESAQRLGWTSADLFGLHTPPANPHPSHSRLSRYDCTGLVWLLQGRPVVALTESTAAVQNPTGNVTTYRRYDKPALGPCGDLLEGFSNELKPGRPPHPDQLRPGMSIAQPPNSAVTVLRLASPLTSVKPFLMAVSAIRMSRSRLR
jgi:hypothetical protein